MNIQLPEKFESIFTRQARYRVWYGGRGSGKSHSIARALLILGMQSEKRILCCREYQASIADSSHRLLTDMIYQYGLDKFYTVTKSEIRGCNGTLFLFRGIKIDPHGIKSLEGVDIAWCEESEKISNESLDILIPTIRKPGSELWFSFNPSRETDPIYQRFVLNAPPNSIVEKVNYKDNPWFPAVLVSEMEHDLRTNPDRYRWIWEGECLGISDAQVFRNKYIVESFETGQERFYFGADWGFAKDPTALVRCFVRNKMLYIDQEAYGVGIDIDEIPQLFLSVEGSNRWPLYADSARPETISYMRKNGFINIKPCRKGPNSVMEGISLLKSAEKIIIHPRCKHTIEEFELYRYKVDRVTGEVLPILVDQSNHIIDALRYAFTGLKHSGTISSGKGIF